MDVSPATRVQYSVTASLWMGTRSLNLATAVGLVLYEAMRQGRGAVEG